MREIKFRAKSLDQDIMVYFSLYEISNYFPSDDVFYVGNIPFKVGSEQEYTGLKDKNGKEIYEGDIIGIKLTSKMVSAIIEWNEREACFGCKWDKDTAKVRKEVGMPNLPANLICGGIGNPWEVIGNIYENPELLEGKQ